MSNAIVRFIRDVADAVRIKTVEAERGITLIDATAADAFEQELRAVTTNDEQRADVRRSAILAAKSGMTSDELEKAIHAYAQYGNRVWYELGMIERYVSARRREFE